MGSTATIPDQDQDSIAPEPETTEAETNDGSYAQCEDFGLLDPAADDTELQSEIRELCRHFAGLDQFARRSEIIEARRQRFYRRGDQYIVSNKEGFFQPWTGGSGKQAASEGDDGRLTDVYNIFWPYLRALIAIGVQNPPGVNFDPDDGTQATDITAARNAEIYRHRIDRVNQRKALQSKIFSLFGTDSRVVLYSRSVRDAQKFGKDKQGQPNSVELMTAFGTLESKCQITANERGELPYMILTDDPEINMAKQEYPQAAGQIRAGISAVGESSYERFARIGILQGAKTLQNAGDAYSHLTVRHRIWLRPAAYRHAADEVRAKLRTSYPDGLKVVWCGDAYCGSSNQTMDDHISIGFPEPGDGMSRASMMKNMIPVQDAFNDLMNLQKELFERAIPMGWRLSDLQDINALPEQRSMPGNWTTVQLPAGIQSLDQAFYMEPSTESPPALQASYENLMGALSQFITGAQPALFGGADKNNDTASGISMLRDQAMGQFGIAWGGFQELMASGYQQAVLCAASKTDDDIVHIAMPGRRGKTLMAAVDRSTLSKGSFHAYPDTDSSFPETTGSKRQTVQALVSQALLNPEAAEAYGVLHPNNLELQRQLLSITDWFIPAADAADKQMGEIELLLEQRPTPDLEAVQKFAADAAMEKLAAAKLQGTGVPTPAPDKPDPNQMYKSSIPVNVKWDYHEFEYQTIKDWLSSADGLEAARTKPWGVLNVRCHGDEHQAAMAAQAPPPDAGAPQADPKGPAPKLPSLPSSMPSPGAQMQGAPHISPGGLQ